MKSDIKFWTLYSILSKKENKKQKDGSQIGPNQTAA